MKNGMKGDAVAAFAYMIDRGLNFRCSFARMKLTFFSNHLDIYILDYLFSLRRLNCRQEINVGKCLVQ